MYSVVMKGDMKGRFLAVNVCHRDMLHATTVGKALPVGDWINSLALINSCFNS